MSEDHYFKYQLYVDACPEPILELWQPIVYGAMLKMPLREFLSRFNWSKDEPFIIPPCGDMPDEVKLICYEAKQLDQDIVRHLLPGDVQATKKAFHDRKRQLLYGQDALSVVEYFEALL